MTDKLEDRARELALKELEELERLEREATPGPWKSVQHETLSDDGTGEIYYGCRTPECHYAWGDISTTGVNHGIENADLIAALRNAAPALLAAARKWVESEHKELACWDQFRAEKSALESENKTLRGLVEECIAEDDGSFRTPLPVRNWLSRARKALGEK